MTFNGKIDKVGNDKKSAANLVNNVLSIIRSRNHIDNVEYELAAIIAWLPGIIGRLDMSYRYVFISPQIEELSGHPPQFYLGKSYDDLENEHIIKVRWRAALDFVARNSVTKEIEHHWTDNRGKTRFFFTRFVPLIDSCDEVVEILTISTDISERQRRTDDLHDEGKTLRKADNRKNEYLATLAHELRGPLAPIASAVQLMKLSTNPSTLVKARDIIERQVSQMAGLIDDLMEVGRINTGKLHVTLLPIAVDTLVRNVVEATQPVFTAKRQQLQVLEIPPNLWVHGDSIRMTQLLSNLLTNASKYSPVGVQARLEVVKVNKNIEFRVVDHGIGLARESISEIFEMFAQVHASGAEARGGLGIGLALAQKIAHLHGGEITVYSAGLNHGSTFTFTVPFADQPNENSEIKNLDMKSREYPLRLLVVDDNVDGADTLSDMLSELGHSVVTAYNGTDAILLLENEPFHLAFLDLGLPDKTGIEVALTVSKKGLGNYVRLIALTGLSREQDRYVTRAAGFDEHLVKPIKFDDVLRLVGKPT